MIFILNCLWLWSTVRQWLSRVPGCMQWSTFSCLVLSYFIIFYIVIDTISFIGFVCDFHFELLLVRKMVEGCQAASSGAPLVISYSYHFYTYSLPDRIYFIFIGFAIHTLFFFPLLTQKNIQWHHDNLLWQPCGPSLVPSYFCFSLCRSFSDPGTFAPALPSCLSAGPRYNLSHISSEP